MSQKVNINLWVSLFGSKFILPRIFSMYWKCFENQGLVLCKELSIEFELFFDAESPIIAGFCTVKQF